MGAQAYFVRTDVERYRASEATGGAWDPEQQHVAPALGLLVHAVEQDREARGSMLVPARFSFDILGPMAIGEVSTSVRVLRPGRTIELVEASLESGGRPAVVARVWLLQASDTTPIAGQSHPAMPGPDDPSMQPWDPTDLWPGGFIASVEVRRDLEEPGRGRAWVRTPLPLVADESGTAEAVTDLAALAGLWDISNGTATRVGPGEVVFPNVDLTAHLFRQPQGAWAGFDTTATFGPDGAGLTSSRLHDLHGPRRHFGADPHCARLMTCE